MPVLPRRAALVAAVQVADGVCTCGAQLATVGYLTGAAGLTFPGEIAKGVSFASVNADGAHLHCGILPTADEGQPGG